MPVLLNMERCRKCGKFYSPWGSKMSELRFCIPCYQRLDTWQQIGLEEEVVA